MKNKIKYSEVREICKDEPLHFESVSSYGGDFYKCYIKKDGIKYLLLCQVYDSTLDELNLREELYELTFSNELTFEWMNWDFYNLSIIHPGNPEKEIIFIKED